MRLRALAVLGLLLFAPLLAGCATKEEEQADVMVTFYPLGFLAERIANGTLRVGTMVPSGIEPHDWNPSPTDLARAAGAKAFLAQGAGFEPWLPDLKQALGGAAPPVFYMTANLPLREGEHDDHAGGEHDDEADHADEDAHADEADANHSGSEGNHTGEEAGHGDEAEANHTGGEDAAHAEEEAGHAGEGLAVDPHTWLDPVLFAEQSKLAEAALVAAFPDKADALRANAAALRADLAALHAEFSAGLAECETRVVVANHDAYGYLAARYGFEVVAISGLSPEAQPSPQSVSRAIEAAREHNATIIFFEELVSDAVARVVADEVGARTRVLSPLEGLAADARARGDDYLDVMRENLAGLREAMRCA